MGSQSGMDSLQLCFPCMYVLDITAVLVGRASTGVVSVMTVCVPYSLYMYSHIMLLRHKTNDSTRAIVPSLHSLTITMAGGVIVGKLSMAFYMLTSLYECLLY